MTKQPISTEASHLNVTYKSGDYTNNLLADYLTIEDSDDEFTLSMDLARNQESDPNTNSADDVVQLLEKIAAIDLIQFSEESAVQSIRRAMLKAPQRKWVLELAFLNGQSYRLNIGPSVDDTDAFLYVQAT